MVVRALRRRDFEGSMNLKERILTIEARVGYLEELLTKEARMAEETEARLLEAMDPSSQERYCIKYPDRFFQCARHWEAGKQQTTKSAATATEHKEMSSSPEPIFKAAKGNCVACGRPLYRGQMYTDM
jgi:hypothetical protein